MDGVLHWIRDDAAPSLAPRVSAHETRGFGMPDGQLLEFSGVTKRFGAVTAVSGLTARVEPGLVTGFLGPNGAGKTTSLRILLGLVRASDGHATIGGKRYADLARPLQTVGAVLEASSFHPGRTAASHLTIYAQAAGIPKARVDEVLGLVGLTDAAGRKVGGFSLGMRQRLGLAYALLGDPGVLVLDEPANGLDPEGIRWMRGFLRQLAAEGRTVLVSSHLLAEVQQTVDALLIISRGRLVFQGSIDELADPSEHATIVDAPDRAALGAALQTAGVPFEVLRSGLTVRGVEPTAVGAVAAGAGVALSSLHRRGPALEEVFLDLVNGTRVHASAGGAVAGAAGAVGAMAAAETAEPDSEAEPEAAVTPEPVAEPVGGGEPEEPGEPEPEVATPEPEVATPQPEVATPQPEVSAPESEGVPPQPEEPEEPEPEVAPEPEGSVSPPDSADAPESTPDPEGAELSGLAEGEASVASEPPASAAYAVASTGVIEVVPGRDDAGEEEDPWAPEDSDPDVGAIGEIDDELSEPVDADARPWESFVRTEADLEADAFFAAFDTGPVPEVAEPEHDSPEHEPEHRDHHEHGDHEGGDR